MSPHDSGSVIQEGESHDPGSVIQEGESHDPGSVIQEGEGEVPKATGRVTGPSKAEHVEGREASLKWLPSAV